MLLQRKYSYPDAVAEIRNRLAPADEIRARHRWVAVTAHIALTAPAIPAGPNWTLFPPILAQSWKTAPGN